MLSAKLIIAGTTIVAVVGSSTTASAAARLSNDQVNIKLRRACITVEKIEEKAAANVPKTSAGLRSYLVVLAKAFSAYGSAIGAITPSDPSTQDATRNLKVFVVHQTATVNKITARLKSISNYERAITLIGESLDPLRDESASVESQLGSLDLYVCDGVMLGSGSDSDSSDTTPPTDTTDPNANPFADDPAANSAKNDPLAIRLGTVPNNGSPKPLSAVDTTLELFIPQVAGYSLTRAVAVDEFVQKLKIATTGTFDAGLGKQLVDGNGTLVAYVLVFHYGPAVNTAVQQTVFNSAVSSLNGFESTPINGFRIGVASFAGFDKLVATRNGYLYEMTALPTPRQTNIIDIAQRIISTVPAS
jgi:hypothetical protein